jgi:four helix bundle protein
MPLIRNFRELEVYELVRAEVRRVFDLSCGFPAAERYSLTDQVRRSSRSVRGHIAEAWGRRRYINSFCYKLDEAMGEANETQAWLETALECGYIANSDFAQADKAWQRIGAMLNSMIDKAPTFCTKSTTKR